MEHTAQPARRFLRWPEVKARIGKSRSTVWREMREGKFPAAIQIGANAIAWDEAEIDSYQGSRLRVSYAPKPTVA